MKVLCSRLSHMVINASLVSPYIAGAMAVAPATASAQEPNEPLEPIEDSIDYIDYPRLPADFRARVPRAKPEALLELVVEGETGILYDSNLFRTPSQAESDLVSVSRAQVRLIYDGPTVDAEFGVDGVLGRHREFQRNDYEDFGARLRTLWGERDTDYAQVDGSVRRGHTAIGADLDTPEFDAAEVTEFYVAEVAVTGALGFDGVTVAPTLSARVLDYQDSVRLNGQPIDNDGKDRVEFGAGLRLSSPVETTWALPTALLVDAGGATRFFGDPDSPADVDRDSTDGFGRVGLAFGNRDDALQGEFGVGPAFFTPNDSSLDDVFDVASLARLQWRIDPANRLALTAERRIRDTLFGGASAIVSTSSELLYVNQTTDELTLGLGAGVDYRDHQMNPEITDLQREDLIYRVEAEATYRITEGLFASISTSHIRNDSTDPSVEYASTRVFMNIGFDF